MITLHYVDINSETIGQEGTVRLIKVCNSKVFYEEVIVINKFDEFFNTLNNNRIIFKKYAADSKLGIRTDILFENNMKKFGKELIANKNEIDRMINLRSTECFNVINLQLNQYTYGEWLACLEEKILLEYTVPIFSRVLEKEPLLYGYHSQGQVLYQIIMLKDDFWNEHNEWKNFFNNIILKMFQNKSEEYLENSLCEEFFQRFKAI